MVATAMSLFTQQMQGPSEILQCQLLRPTVDPKDLGRRRQKKCKERTRTTCIDFKPYHKDAELICSEFSLEPER